MSSELISKYRDKLRGGLSLNDVGGYNLAASEMNPAILGELISAMFDSMLPPVIWEPFAGVTKKSALIDFAEDNGVKMLSQTLCPRDPRIKSADSTVSGPSERIGGVLFHPPYFGSKSVSQRDVCKTEKKTEYLENLRKVVGLIGTQLVVGGLVCAVGRDYRIGGKRIQLSEWYLELFGGYGYSIEEVWLSEPDVAVIFRTVMGRHI